MQLTANFHSDEFRCKCKVHGLAQDNGWCDGEVWVHRELVDRLQRLRDLVGSPVVVTSGCRCPRYNAWIGGVPMSQHKRGTAADIVVDGYKPRQLEEVAKTVGFTWTKVYPTFLHVDVRGLI